MELRHLRYFASVADELNFTRAARKLRVAQPALSRQIRQLEEELGVALLERNRRGTRLTDAGTAFLAEARAVLQRSQQAVRAAQTAGQPGPRTLNVGYVWGLFHSLVPQAVQQFRVKFPEVAVNLFDQTATQQADQIQQGRLDAGFIGFAQEADAAGLAKRRVGHCDFVVAVPEAHPASQRQRIDLATLAAEAFFVISEENYPGAARQVSEACARAGFRPRILQAAERGHTLLALVAGNCGVALVPEPLQALPHPGVVFRPLKNGPSGDLYIAWRSEHLSELGESFVNSVPIA